MGSSSFHTRGGGAQGPQGPTVLGARGACGRSCVPALVRQGTLRPRGLGRRPQRMTQGAGEETRPRGHRRHHARLLAEPAGTKPAGRGRSGGGWGRSPQIRASSAFSRAVSRSARKTRDPLGKGLVLRTAVRPRGGGWTQPPHRPGPCGGSPRFLGDHHALRGRLCRRATCGRPCTGVAGPSRWAQPSWRCLLPCS